MAEEPNQNIPRGPSGDLPGELPDDLQIPVSSAPQGMPPKVVSDPEGLLQNQRFSEPEVKTRREAVPPPVVVRSETIMPPIVPKPITFPKVARRVNWWSWLLGVLIVGLLAGTVYLVLTKLDFQRGVLEMTFDPPGVQVTIDNKFKKSPVGSLTIKLKAGSHNILVTKDGYVDFERDIELAAKETAKLDIKLSPVPTIEVLVDEPVNWLSFTNNGRALVFVDTIGGFVLFDLTNRARAGLFSGSIPNIKTVVWSATEINALVKLLGKGRLPNTHDNSAVVGRFIPLGNRPTQGTLKDNGETTWLFRSSQANALGWQPILLNGNIRSASFSPEGDSIIYFYETAEGEKSAVLAHIDGTEWERLKSELEFVNPVLSWLNNDRYVLWADDIAGADKIFDVVEKEFTEAMPDRIKYTAWSDSPDGNRIAYLTNADGGQKLAVWNVAEQKVEKVFDKPIEAFTWQSDDQLVVGLADGSLWRWYLNGKERPVQFLSAVGQLRMTKLLYNAVSGQIIIIDNNSKVFSLEMVV